MARYSAHTQTHAVMDEKRQVARTLLHRGLTIRQISAQLRCSSDFIRRVRREMDHESVGHAAQPTDTLDNEDAGAA